MEIIIETPKGSREKYKYDKEHHLFRLHKVLPTGLAFPFDFGFLPGTKGEDGDPLDAMVISEFQGFAGCIMDCRVIGCITVEQSFKTKFIRNDRFLAVPEVSVLFENVLSIEDLPPTLMIRIESFFTTYMHKEGKKYLLTGNLNAEKAIALLND